jgi:hypothetical protein
VTNTSSDLEVLRNRTFDEIAVGDHATIEPTPTAADIQLFAAMSGDINPRSSPISRAAACSRSAGARVPIILANRCDSRESRIAACAVALVAARRSAKPGAITALPSAQPPSAPALAARAAVRLEPQE